MNVRVARMTTTALAGACGVLLLFALLQYAGLGRGYGWASDDPANAPTLPGAPLDEKPLKFPPESAFAAIDAHPLFNEDRQPTPIDASEDAEGDQPPPNPLNIALTGIVSTSSVKVAMVHDKARNQSVALKVGMPLEGDQAGWTLVEVKPRSVVFQSATNEKTEVELETSVAPPSQAMPRSARSSSRSRTQPNPRTNGNDLAKRIEERRRQMREDAERLKQQRQGGPAKPPPPRKPYQPPKK